MGRPDARFAGMTVNERLSEAGLLAAFDTAARNRDRAKMIALLGRVALPPAQAAATADAVLTEPRRYGY